MATAIKDRQYPIYAFKELTYANVGVYTVTLPPGALLETMYAVTSTAFNSVTTATLTVSDGTTTYINGVDLKSTGSETVSNTPAYYPSGGTLTITTAQTGGDATAGVCALAIRYTIKDRSHEIG